MAWKMGILFLLSPQPCPTVEMVLGVAQMNVSFNGHLALQHKSFTLQRETCNGKICRNFKKSRFLLPSLLSHFHLYFV